MQDGRTLPDLVTVMKRLLAPDGCPWDREQTLGTLKTYLLEETYEVLEAIEGGTPAEHREELGDLLMQIVFQAELRAAEGHFGIDDVVGGIADKLRRRHPHVFGEARADTAAEVLAQWNDLKVKEKADKGEKRRVLEGVPLAMPALARAERLQERASAVGFDWPDVAGPLAKIREETAELEGAIATKEQARVEAELGDLLFAAVNAARKLGVDAESALRGATARFERRFRHVEERLAAEGRSPRESTLEEMDRLWIEAKSRE